MTIVNPPGYTPEWFAKFSAKVKALLLLEGFEAKFVVRNSDHRELSYTPVLTVTVERENTFVETFVLDRADYDEDPEQAANSLAFELNLRMKRAAYAANIERLLKTHNEYLKAGEKAGGLFDRAYNTFTISVLQPTGCCLVWGYGETFKEAVLMTEELYQSRKEVWPAKARPIGWYLGSFTKK